MRFHDGPDNGKAHAGAGADRSGPEAFKDVLPLVRWDADPVVPHADDRFALPAFTLVLYSIMTQAADGTVGLPLTLAHYQHFFTIPVYSRVLLTTLRISLWTTALAALLAYPVALVMVRSPPFLRQAITMVVIAPLSSASSCGPMAGN